MSFILKKAPVLLLLLAFSLGACRTTPGRNPPVKEPEKKVEPGETDPKKGKGEPEDKKGGEKDDPADLVEDKRPDKKGRRVTTHFSGGVMVRETVTIDGIPTTRISMGGGAFLRHNGVTISSPRIVLEGGVIGRCIGGVTIRDPKNGLYIRAKSAIYNRDEQKIHLSGDPYMISRKNKKDKPMLITAVKLWRDLAANVSYMDQDVRILQGGFTLIADKGVFTDKTDEIVMSEDPMIITQNQFFTGKQMIYFSKDRKVELKGQVVNLSRGNQSIELLSQKSEKYSPASLETFARKGGRVPKPSTSEKVEKKEDEAIESRLTSDRLVYFFPREKEPYTELHGNIMLTQKDVILKANFLEIKGKDFDIIQTHTGMDLVERKQNIHVTAGKMRYDRKTQNIILEDDPKMEFYRKGTEDDVRATLSGAVIERDIKANRTYARGNVKIFRDDYEATGELATYQEDAGVIVMEGEPSLKQGGGRIRCEQILIFPDKNRILLQNRITGFMSED